MERDQFPVELDPALATNPSVSASRKQVRRLAEVRRG